MPLSPGEPPPAPVSAERPRRSAVKTQRRDAGFVWIVLEPALPGGGDRGGGGDRDRAPRGVHSGDPGQTRSRTADAATLFCSSRRAAERRPRRSGHVLGAVTLGPPRGPRPRPTRRRRWCRRQQRVSRRARGTQDGGPFTRGTCGEPSRAPGRVLGVQRARQPGRPCGR